MTAHTMQDNSVTPIHLHWMETRSGKKFDLLNPSSSMIEIEDIAWGLSRINRFNGHTELPMPYTVADHSLWVAGYVYTKTCDPEAALQGLLHDAHEAYTGDIITPIKTLPGVFEGIVKLQARIQMAIRFGLDVSHQVPAVVEVADRLALTREVQVMMPSGGKQWSLQPLDQIATHIASPKCRAPMRGYEEFMIMYRRLTAEIANAKPTREVLS